MNLLDIDTSTASRVIVEQAVVAWRTKREERLAQDKIAADLKKEESAICNWVISALQQQEMEGVIVGGRITSAVEEEVYIAEDKDAVIKYILENDAIELLQFRLSAAAIDERKAEGIAVPGVGTMVKYKLSDRKAK